MRPKTTQVEKVHLSLLPIVNVAEERQERGDPDAVASLSLNGNTLQGLVSMRVDALVPVLQMLIADRFRYVSLHGGRLRYGKALLRSYRFRMSLDEDDEVVVSRSPGGGQQQRSGIV